MKCLILFSRKNKKHIHVISLLSAEFSFSMISIKILVAVFFCSQKCLCFSS